MAALFAPSDVQHRPLLLCSVVVCGLLSAGCTRDMRFMSRTDWGFLDRRAIEKNELPPDDLSLQAPQPVASRSRTVTTHRGPGSTSLLAGVKGSDKTASGDPFLNQKIDVEPSGVRVQTVSQTKTLAAPKVPGESHRTLPQAGGTRTVAAVDKAQQIRAMANQPARTTSRTVSEEPGDVELLPPAPKTGEKFVEILVRPAVTEPVVAKSPVTESKASRSPAGDSKSTPPRPEGKPVEHEPAEPPSATPSTDDAIAAATPQPGASKTSEAEAVHPQLVVTEPPAAARRAPAEPPRPGARMPTVWKAGKPENLDALLSTLEPPAASSSSIASAEPVVAAESKTSFAAPRLPAPDNNTPRQRLQVSGSPAPLRPSVRLAGRIEVEADRRAQAAAAAERDAPWEPAVLPPPVVGEPPSEEYSPQLASSEGPARLPQTEATPVTDAETSVDPSTDLLSPLPLAEPTWPKLTTASRAGLALGLAGLLGIGLWRFLEWRRYRNAIAKR